MLGFQDGAHIAAKLYSSHLTRAYKLHGKLGTATDTYFVNGKVVEKASYKNVTRTKMDKIASYIQTMHQRKMFE